MTPEQAAMLRRVEIRLEIRDLREQQNRLFASHAKLMPEEWPQGVRDLIGRIGEEIRSLKTELESLGGRVWMS